MKRRLIFHPFVFAAYPILTVYVNNMRMTSLAEAVRAIVFALVCAGLLWWLVNLLVKHAAKSAIIASAFVMLFFAYGYALLGLTNALVRLQWLERARFLVEGTGSHILWLCAWAGLLVAVSWLVSRQQSDLRTATGFLNVAAIAFLAILGARFAMGAGDLLEKPRLREAWRDASTLPSIGSAPDGLPDIYYIIVDAYGRADLLEEVYGLDNSELLSQLAGRGFYVADRSRSNYAQTALSLASSLNFDYLDDLVDSLDAFGDNRIPMQILIEDNRFVRFLRQQGYTIVEFESGYEYTRIEHDTRLTPFPGWSPSEFEEGLIMLTPLSAFRTTWADYRRQRIEYAFEHLADPAQDSGPTFTFVHLLAPHWPFLFDADGNAIQPKGVGSHVPIFYEEFITYYSQQLLYTNKRLVPAIDAILSQSSEPPIVIVQADHGPDAGKNTAGSDWESAVRERMAILNAFYFPGADYERLYEEITPVNTFRVLLNHYLGADLDLLEDRVFYSSYEAPYAVTDVTDLTAE
jgi:hypothetical protein